MFEPVHAAPPWGGLAAHDDDDPLWAQAAQLHAQFALPGAADAGGTGDADARCGAAALPPEAVKAPPGGPAKGSSDDLERCAHCGVTARQACDGVIVCSGCGTVLARQLDYGAEWRYYGAEDSARAGGVMTVRCGPPSGLISALGSVVSLAPRRTRSTWANRTEASAASAEAQRRGCVAVQRHHAWNSLTYRERVLCGVFDTIGAVAAQHGLPACLLEEAKQLYTAISRQRITRGDIRTAAIAASVYIACRKSAAPRNQREVAAMFNIKPALLTKACRMFESVLPNADQGLSTAADFVGRFCSQLALPRAAIDAVRSVVAQADMLTSVCDATPSAVAAGAIELVCEHYGLLLPAAARRQAVAGVCLVSTATVGKTTRKLAQHREALLPQLV